MTKKHFIELADCLKKPGMIPAAVERAIGQPDISDDTVEAIKQRVLKAIADELADFCNAQNPNFNRQRWLEYIAGECGPNGGNIKK